MGDERKSVFITGSSSGIGRLTALTVARAGYRVYASMRCFKSKNQDAARELSDLARSEGLDLQVLELDVAEPISIEHAVKDLSAKGRRIDVLVNNAGKMPIGISEGFTDEQLHEHFALNFYGPVRLCRALLPQMRERKSGLIIHVSSILGRLLLPGCSIYCASKFALEAYAEVLHYELTGLGIESVLVEPGPYPTNLLPNDLCALFAAKAMVPPSSIGKTIRYKRRLCANLALKLPWIASPSALLNRIQRR